MFNERSGAGGQGCDAGGQPVRLRHRLDRAERFLQQRRNDQAWKWNPMARLGIHNTVLLSPDATWHVIFAPNWYWLYRLEIIYLRIPHYHKGVGRFNSVTLASKEHPFPKPRWQRQEPSSISLSSTVQVQICWTSLIKLELAYPTLCGIFSATKCFNLRDFQ